MNRNLLLKSIAAILVIAWLFAVTFNYYIVHKPFTIENALAILNALGEVLVAGALFALAAALGRRVTRRVSRLGEGSGRLEVAATTTQSRPSSASSLSESRRFPLKRAASETRFLRENGFLRQAARVCEGRLRVGVAAISIACRLDALGVTFAAPLEALVLQTGLGLGLIAFATLALGLVGALNRVLFWLLLLLAAFWLRNDLRAAWRDLRALRLPLASRFERGLAAFCAASLALAFLLALTPPIGWDAQTYHLVIPKVALEQGRITAPPDIVYFSFPSLVEMLFLAAMLLKGDIAAQVVHLGFFLLTLGAVFAFAQRYFNARVAWLSCAILVAVPSLLLVATWAYVDLALAFYAFAAFYALMIASETNDQRGFALSGAFAGMAMGVKYTAAIIPIALLVLLLLHIFRAAYSVSPFTFHVSRSTYSISPFIFHVLRFTFFVILFAAPWYLRNLVFTGNPVYPFVFGGPYWDAFRGQWFSRFGTGLMNAPLQLLLAPWDATVYGVEGALGYEATLGPLLLMLLPLLLVRIQNSKPANCATRHASRVTFYVSRISNLELLFIYSLFLYLFWLVGIAASKLLLQTRLLFPAFPCFALLAAEAFERLSALDFPQFSAQRFARLVIALVLGLTLLGYGLAFASNSPLAYLSGAESRARFLARTLGEYARAVEFVNASLPAEARLLALWEPRAYYVHRAIQPDSLLDGWTHMLSQTREAEAIARAWQREGYTHVLLNRRGLNLMFTSQYDPLDRESVQALQTVLARHARLVYGEPLEVVGGEIARADASPYAVYALEWR